MSNRLVEMRTVQQYKEYAESTEQLNEALNNEIKQCYWQIESLRADLKRQTEGSPNRDAEGRLINQLKLQIGDLEGRLKEHQAELQGLRQHSLRIEIELKEAQQQCQFKSRLLAKADEELRVLKEEERQANRKSWEQEQRCRSLEEQILRQAELSKVHREREAESSEMESRKQEQQELEELRQKLGQAEQKIRVSETQLKRSQQDNAWLKQLVADKAALEEMLMKQVASVTNQRVAAERIAKQAQAAQGSARSELGELRQRLAVQSAELKQYQNKLHLEEQRARRCIEQSSELKSSLSKKDQLNSRLQATTKQLETRLLELDEEIAGYRKLTDQSRRSLAQSRQTNQETLQLRSQVGRLASELAAKNQAAVQFRDQIEELSQHISKLQATHTLPPVEEELELAANEIISLRNQLHQSNDYKQYAIVLCRAVIKLREENAHLKATLASFEEEGKRKSQETLRQSNQACQKLESSRLKSDFAEALRKNNALIEANARLEIVRNELHDEIEQLKKERVQLLPGSEAEINELKQRLAEAYSQMDQLSSTLNKENSSQCNSLKQSNFSGDKSSWRPNLSSLKMLKASTSEHWLDMQRKIDGLRSQNDTLRKNLSFGGCGQWRG